MKPLPADQSAELLILRKTPFQDDSMIVNGVSAEHGRMAFIVRLPSQRGKNKGGFLDIFQVAQMEYRHSDSDIFRGKATSISADYTGVATSKNGYEPACRLARFALANTHPQVPIPQFYQALQVALIRLRGDASTPEAILTGVGLAFLNEAGWLSPVEMDPRKAAQCQILLQMAAGGDIPQLEPKVWNALLEWTRSRLLDAECVEIF